MSSYENVINWLLSFLLTIINFNGLELLLLFSYIPVKKNNCVYVYVQKSMYAAIETIDKVKEVC